MFINALPLVRTDRPLRAADWIRRRLCRRMLKDEGGATAVMVAIGLTMLIGFLAIGTDAARIYIVKSRLGSAVDAAALAGGQSYFDSNRDEQIKMFFNVNFPPGYLGATASTPKIDGTGGETLSVSASAVVPTTLMRLFGDDEVTVSAGATVNRTVRQMELALVMDNTGSMAGTKMTSMKDAAKDLIDIVYGEQDSHPNLWVSLVPYVATVNIGSGRTSWLLPTDKYFNSPSPFSPGTWKGCVEARPSPYDKTDDPPSVQLFSSFLYESGADNVWPPIDERQSKGNNGHGPNLGCGPAITPLVQSKTTVKNAITAMNAWSRGGTTSNLGMVWGWRTISPRWRGVWGGTVPADRPIEYNDRLGEKVIVLLTDGDNQFYDFDNNGTSDDTAYGRVTGCHNNSCGTTGLNEDLTDMCEEIKSHDVTIYTITFGSSPSNATKTLYRNCASLPDFYFHAADGTEVSEVFHEIGRQLSNLRLSL